MAPEALARIQVMLRKIIVQLILASSLLCTLESWPTIHANFQLKDCIYSISIHFEESSTSILHAYSLRKMKESRKSEITVNLVKLSEYEYKLFDLENLFELLNADLENIMGSPLYDIEDMVQIMQLADFLGFNRKIVKYYALCALDHFDVYSELILHESILHLFDLEAIVLTMKNIDVILRQKNECQDLMFETLDIIRMHVNEDMKDIIRCIDRRLWDSHGFEWAVKTQNIDVLLGLFENEFTLNENCWNIAVKDGFMDLFEIASNMGISIPSSVASLASSLGRLDLIVFLDRNGAQFEQDILENAAKFGHIDILKYLHCVRGEKLTENLLRHAITYDQLESMIWLFENGCPYSMCILQDVACSRNFELYEWFYENLPNLFSDIVMILTVSSGSLKWTKYICERYPTLIQNRLMIEAASFGHLEILVYLHETFGMDVDDFAFQYSAGNGRLEVVKWIMENAPLDVSHAVSLARKQGQMEVLQYFHDLGIARSLKFSIFLRIQRWISSIKFM